MRAIDVANYLVERWGREYPVTSLRLGVMLYRAQVASVAATGEPLFEDRIEAWQCGPVVPAVARALGESDGARITEPLGRAEVASELAPLIDSVANEVGPLSAFDLVSLARRPGGAWAGAYRPGCAATITPEAIAASADVDVRTPEPLSATLDAVARAMPCALKMLETS